MGLEKWDLPALLAFRLSGQIGPVARWLSEMKQLWLLEERVVES
jgi:hypothetical protein